MPKRRRGNETLQEDDDGYSSAAYPAPTAMTPQDVQSGDHHLDESNTRFPDANSSTRRVLASVACNACRSRKSKCDEQWPVCGACSRLRLRCKYEQRRKTKVDLYLETISGSLQQLQHSTDHLVERMERLPMTESRSPVAARTTLTDHSPSHAQSESRHDGYESQRVQHPPDVDFPQSRYLTAAHELYNWPPIARAVPGVDLTYPVPSERSRPPLSAAVVAPYCLASSDHPRGDWCDSMSLSQVRTLLNHYFDDLYQVYPIIEKRKLLESATTVSLERGFGIDHESCSVLLALALGSLVAYLHGETEWGHECMDDVTSPVGIGFFNRARQTLAFLPRGHIGTAQCHVLVGLYYAQLVRVYDFWASIHEAAVIFFNVISTSPEEKTNPDVRRGYWVTYILECTILSELDLRPSGLYQLQDDVPMAFDHEEPHTQERNPETEWQFVLLANIALRRLLNRAYRNWKGSVLDGTANPSANVNHELALQLDDWFHHLPPSIAVQMGTDDERNRQRYPRNLLGLLRGRYWAAKSVVYRPYVYKALSSTPEALTADDILCFQRCLEAGLQVPQEIGFLTDTARLVVSPFAPIRSFMATYTLLCAARDVPHLRHYATAQLGLAEEIRRKIHVEFRHLSALVDKDMGLLEQYVTYLESTPGVEYP